MDKYLRRFPALHDGDLVIARGLGVAWQADMTPTTTYGDDYLSKVDAYDGTPIAEAVNAGRCAMLARHVPAGAELMDFGAGSGAFVRAAGAAGYAARGFDLIPAAADRLRAAGVYAEDLWPFRVVTAWDVIEHLEAPGDFLDSLPSGTWLFVSIPIFDDLSRIRESKHYRPGEHLVYFSHAGFIEWTKCYGYELIETDTFEIRAGRESIHDYALRKT